MKSGVECEYFLINNEGTGIADKKDIQSTIDSLKSIANKKSNI